PCFQSFPVGNVFGEEIQTHHSSGCVAHHASTDPHLDLVTVPAAPRAFKALDGSSAQQCLLKGVEALGGGENKRQVANQQIGARSRFVSQHLQHGRIHLKELPALGGAANGVRRLF